MTSLFPVNIKPAVRGAVGISRLVKDPFPIVDKQAVEECEGIRAYGELERSSTTSRLNTLSSQQSICVVFRDADVGIAEHF